MSEPGFSASHMTLHRFFPIEKSYLLLGQTHFRVNLQVGTRCSEFAPLRMTGSRASPVLLHFVLYRLPIRRRVGSTDTGCQFCGSQFCVSSRSASCTSHLPACLRSFLVASPCPKPDSPRKRVTSGSPHIWPCLQLDVLSRLVASLLWTSPTHMIPICRNSELWFSAAQAAAGGWREREMKN